MAFGLTSTPGTFQGAMNSTLAGGLWKFVIVFFDAILIYSRTFTDHVQHLSQVLQWLASDNWKLKQSKCTFAPRSIAYLGHVVSVGGVSTDPAKVQAIMDWPCPSSIRNLRGFLGLAGYYRKFIKNFTLLAKPLSDLLRKDTLFVWSSVQDAAFTLLK